MSSQSLASKSREVVPYINWIYFFHAWGMEPRYATIAEVHACPSCRAGWIASFAEADRAKAREAVTLHTDAMSLLRQWSEESVCRAKFLIANAHSEGDDIIIDGIRFPFLRQQKADKEGYTLCLSDFIRGAITTEPSPEERALADIANKIGVFAASVTLPSTLDEQYSLLLASTLADRLAEATTEKMHEEVRKHYWGYAKDEQLSIRQLHEEEFQGIRPAVGYPSLPDQSINFLIDKIINFSDIGITLSSSGAMSPSSSVSGFMIAHPKARYFAIGNIGEDQLRDYAARRGLGVEESRCFLNRNL